MTSQEIDPRSINTIACPQCHRFAVVTSTEREVVELESEDFDGMSEGQIADYEGELAMGGGANWTELVESATCATCHVTLIRRTLGGVETVQIFDTHPVLKAKPAIAMEVTKRSTAPKAKVKAKPVAKKRMAAAKKAKPAPGAKKATASKKAKPSKPKNGKPSKPKPKPKTKRPKARKASRR